MSTTPPNDTNYSANKATEEAATSQLEQMGIFSPIRQIRDDEEFFALHKSMGLLEQWQCSRENNILDVLQCMCAERTSESGKVNSHRRENNSATRTRIVRQQKAGFHSIEAGICKWACIIIEIDATTCMCGGAHTWDSAKNGLLLAKKAFKRGARHSK